MTASRKHAFLLTAAAIAPLASFGPAVAADGDDLAELTKPSSVVELGVGLLGDDNQRFGQYTGLKDSGGYGLLDFDVIRRDDGTGTWLKFKGRNLGLDHRELRFEHNRQGDWGYFIDFSQTPRYDPFTVRTTLSGIGSTTQTINGFATAREYELKTRRDTWTLGLDKYLGNQVGLQVRFRNEEKDGARLWGQGTFGTWRFLTDPIDQTTRQLDATLNYNTKSLQLWGGYYGTSFENKNNVLNVVGATIFSGSDQMALPPDNQSHQLHLAGGYNFTETTRGTFKLAWGRITQNEAFQTTPLVVGAPSDLGGRIDTTLAQAGLTARPMPKLSLLADLRYENRNDKTPVFRYFPSQNTATSTNDGTYEPRDIRTTSGKVEANYRLPMGFRVTGGVEYVEKKRNSPPIRAVGYRETTDETSFRAELRRAVSETVTGALSYIYSTRGGSDYLINTRVNGTVYSNQVAPWHIADRDRNMWRLTINWIPIEPLSLNFRLDEARDQYSGRGISVVEQNARKGKAQNYSVDAAYAFSEAVQGTAWYSRNTNQFDAQSCRAVVPDVCTPGVQQVWGANLRSVADSFGFGLRAKATAKLELGADVIEWKVRDEMPLTLVAGAALPVPPPDEINTKVTTLKLDATYALQRNSGIRVMYIFDRYDTDDWTWANWAYSPTEGGTTVTQEPSQRVHFIGVSYYYRFQ